MSNRGSSQVLWGSYLLAHAERAASANTVASVSFNRTSSIKKAFYYLQHLFAVFYIVASWLFLRHHLFDKLKLSIIKPPNHKIINSSLNPEESLVNLKESREIHNITAYRHVLSNIQKRPVKSSIELSKGLLICVRLFPICVERAFHIYTLIRMCTEIIALCL